METSEQINSVINNLADKLQVPVDYVFQTITQQAMIQGITNLIFIILSIAVFVVAIKVLPHIDKVEEKNGEDLTCVIFFILCGLIMASIIFLISHIGETITCFVNPEYWSLQQIMSMIKQ